MKLFAFYLPQFHTIPENDEWWGNGFTEWTNIKKSKPLFAGHAQPIHPLNNNYYNLLEKSTVIWQTELMKKYGLDGFIYYHYYFNGRLLLEKPAANLLANKDINQRFFFCWANHSWKKSWDGTSKMLVEQTYGDQESWEKHFQYLLPFFKDSRYEKKNNRPLFMVFLPYFSENDKMMEYFNKRCIDEGFDGIEIIDSIHNIYSDDFRWYEKQQFIVPRTIFLREPSIGQLLFERNHRLIRFSKRCALFLKNHFKIGHYVMTFSGDKLIKEAMRFKPMFNNYCNGIFFEWDNTPRHGTRGYIIKPITKKIFKRYMNFCSNQEYMFINAWNEWCEGMILEPTEEKQFKYLEWIKDWKNNSSNQE